MTSRLHGNFTPVANLNKLFLIFCLFITGHAFAQPGIEYDKISKIEGKKLNTKDGGYLIYGDPEFDSNYNIAKYDAAGTPEWKKTFHGDVYDRLISVIQTSDGGYLLGGNSGADKGADKSEDTYDTDDLEIYDYWIIKITADGTKQWDKTLGGAGVDVLNSMLETPDGGFLIAGNSNSPASAVKTLPAITHFEYNFLTDDYWLVKLAPDGAVEWDQRIGGDDDESLITMRAISGGGYLLAGTSSSHLGYDKTMDTRGGADFWIITITSAGVKVSENVYGGSDAEYLLSLEPTSDGGFILGGTSGSKPGGDKTSPHFGPAGYYDYWLVKVNAALEKEWDSTFGGLAHDYFATAKQTSDGGYLALGASESEPGGNRTAERKGSGDLWIIKTDANGVKKWEKSLSDGSELYPSISVQLTADGGFVIQSPTGNRSVYQDKTSFGTGLWEIKLLADSNHNKLSFSKPSLAFELLPYAPDPATPQSVILSASTGNPSISFVENLTNDWVLLPEPALGPLWISVDGSSFGTYTYRATLTATAQGYERAILPISLVSVDNNIPPVLHQIGNKTVIKNVPLTFTATAEVQTGQTKLFSLGNAPEGATIHPTTGVFNWRPSEAGVYRFIVKVTAGAAPSLTVGDEVVVLVLDESINDIVRINCGGGDYTTRDGRQFIADQYFTGFDRTSSNDTIDILNTEDDELYRSGRAAQGFGYRIPMRNGIVKVTLHFAEIYWGVSPIRPGGLKQRRFWVNAEDKTLLQDYDIIAAAGGTLTAVQESFEVLVEDGVLTLEFAAIKDAARISAIEVERLQPQTTLKLTPVADAFIRKGTFSDRNYGTEPTLDCKVGTREDLNRESYLKFSLDSIRQVGAAKLRVYGYNYEGGKNIILTVLGLEDDAWTETGITAANAPADPGMYLGRIYATRHENYLEIDVTDFVKAQLSGNKLVTFRINTNDLSNARAVLNSRENPVNPPQLEIISLDPVNPRSRLAAEEITPEDKTKPNASSVYPNPVKDRIRVNVSNRHSADVSMQLLNVSGSRYQTAADSRIVPGGKTEIDISNLALQSGLYLLNVHSEKHTEILKVLVVQ